VRLVLVAALVLAALVIGLTLGATPTSPAAVWRGLTDPAAPHAVIVRTIRLPRVLLAFAVGGGLAVCGASLQALVRNPLADPYLLGLSGGAGLGAVGAIALALDHPWAVPIAGRWSPVAGSIPWCCCSEASWWERSAARS
jgi:iron complex transport system permease protein